MARNTGRGSTWGGQHPTGPTDNPRSYKSPTAPTWGNPRAVTPGADDEQSTTGQPPDGTPVR